ncbi:MAG: STAS domain-containing protein [Candidatus Sulfotelmatobacter sp.]|jgi:anti-sigma B factor antagonist
MPNFVVSESWTLPEFRNCAHLQNRRGSRNLGAWHPTSISAPRARPLAEDSLDISVRRRSQVQVVQLRGPLRMGPAVDGLRQTMEEALASGDTRMVLNLAEVSMIDSSGIGLLVKFLASAKQRGGNIKLVQPNKFAVQTLKLVGVINLFEIFENDDAAVESFAA